MGASERGLTRRQALLKRSFDLTLSVIGLGLFSWAIVLGWAAASIDTRGNGLYLQERIGRQGRRFRVIKLRTMRPESELDTTVTVSSDRRITRLGRWLRRTKVDELPQLINVLKGEMSFVGPRPDVPGFADELKGEDRVVLSVRPGITGPASIKYRDEEQLLAEVDDPEEYNRTVIFPDKLRINRDYVENYRFVDDFRYLWKTLFH